MFQATSASLTTWRQGMLRQDTYTYSSSRPNGDQEKEHASPHTITHSPFNASSGGKPFTQTTI